MSVQAAQLNPDFRQYLTDLKRQISREIGMKQSQLRTINKILGNPADEGIDHSDLTNAQSECYTRK